MQVKDGKQNAYYIEDRSFSLPELKILIDAVQAASFITDKKSDDLIRKIAALGGSHQAEILTGNIVHFNTRKHTNEHIYYNVSLLEEAIRNKQKAAFRYFDLDEKLNKVYRRNGAVYNRGESNEREQKHAQRCRQDRINSWDQRYSNTAYR